MKFIITKKQYKRLVNEQKSIIQTGRFINMFKKQLDGLSQGIVPQMDDKDEYDVVQFVNGEGKLLFRYNYEQKRLMYDIENVLNPIHMATPNGIAIDDYRFLDNLIKTWAEENLVPKFNDYIEEEFGESFEIDDCHSDEEYYDWKNEQNENLDV